MQGIKTPELNPVDLAKGDNHDHPDIATEKTYLVRYNGRWYVGSFVRLWYGLHFDAMPEHYYGGVQFDAPGTNESRWEAIWEIVDG